MQPSHYILASGILWLATLIILPFLFSKARRRSYSAGFAEHQRLSNSYISALNKDISQLTDARAEDQRKHDLTVANLKRTITELEERILSYTGLAVTKADYDLLTSIADTLHLAERTLRALKSQTHADRAGSQSEAATGLAKRILAQLSGTPATTAGMEKAA